MRQPTSRCSRLEKHEQLWWCDLCEIYQLRGREVLVRRLRSRSWWVRWCRDHLLDGREAGRRLRCCWRKLGWSSWWASLCERGKWFRKRSGYLLEEWESCRMDVPAAMERKGVFLSIQPYRPQIANNMLHWNKTSRPKSNTIRIQNIPTRLL